MQPTPQQRQAYDQFQKKLAAQRTKESGKGTQTPGTLDDVPEYTPPSTKTPRKPPTTFKGGVGNDMTPINTGKTPRKSSFGSNKNTNKPSQPTNKPVSFSSRAEAAKNKMNNRINNSAKTLRNFVSSAPEPASNPNHIDFPSHHNSSTYTPTTPRVTSRGATFTPRTPRVYPSAPPPPRPSTNPIHSPSPNSSTAPPSSTQAPRQTLNRSMIPQHLRPVANQNKSNLQRSMQKAQKYQSKDQKKSFKNRLIKKFTNRNYWNKDIKPALSSIFSTLQR